MTSLMTSYLRKTMTEKKTLTKEIMLIHDFNKFYKKFLIFKFSNISRRSWLINEQLKKIIVKNELILEKKNVLTKMLFNREITIAWNFLKIKRVKSEVVSSQKIKMISHKIWQSSTLLISKTLNEMIIKILQDWINREILEFCHKSYCNSYFLIKKKKFKKYQFINATMKINWVIIRDVNLFSSMNDFFENFMRCIIASLVDIFFDYDHVELTEKFQDLIKLMISIKLFQQTTLFQKEINSVTQFVRIRIKILQNHIFEKARFFLDDIDIKKFKFNYENELVLSRVRRYIMKHIQWIDKMFVDLKRIECIIFDEKSQFCVKKLKIVKYVCDVNKRHFNYAKIDKIMN